jgi:hypothetical protein
MSEGIESGSSRLPARANGNSWRGSFHALPPTLAKSRMKRGVWVMAVLLGLVALGVPDLARAELKLAILKVKGMVCPS